jgi:cytosine/adenosine deaminase-related metal-dependent hydrolase
MFAEMRELAASQPSLRPREILEMATLNGARALGMKNQLGRIGRGAFADLISIPFDGKTTDIYDAVLQHTGDVAASMIDGRWAIAP